MIEILTLISTTYIAIVLCVSGISKALYRRNFEGSMRAHAVLPNWLILQVSYGIPIIELALALLLVWFPFWGGVSVAGLFLLFSVYKILLLTKRAEVTDCGCHGPNFSSKVDIVGVLAVLIQVGISAFIAIAGLVAGDGMRLFQIGISLFVLFFIAYSVFAYRKRQKILTHSS